MNFQFDTLNDFGEKYENPKNVPLYFTILERQSFSSKDFSVIRLRCSNYFQNT